MKFIATSLLLAATQSAFAISGNDALEHFTGSYDKLLYFQTYAKGVVDSESAVSINAGPAAQSGSKYIRPFCMPRAATTQQAAMIIESYMRRNPAGNHLDLYLITRRALTEAWPCSDAQVLGTE
jgi:hypothetical protein